MTGALAGKRALVTGGASGIGRAIALASRPQVPGGGRRPRAAGADRGRGRRDRRRGGEALAVHADVAEEAQVLALFEAVAGRFGGLDILVNNAGILIEKPLLETTAEDFDRLIGVNLRGAFLVGREALRVMARQGEGRVINIASELAYLGRENCSVYCASKGGVLSMTRAWAREFAPASWSTPSPPARSIRPCSAPSSRRRRRSPRKRRTRSAGSGSRRRSRAPPCSSPDRAPPS